MKVCVVTDNDFLYQTMQSIIKEDVYCDTTFDFYFSPWNVGLKKKYENEEFCPLKLSEQDDSFFSEYDLFLSLHCKQLFPASLVKNHRCINVHPGYNPYNRGWFPQVFSILNGAPAGVTIHVMDEELDHGPILYQETIEILEEDTSYDAYCKIQDLEVSMLKRYLPKIIQGLYDAFEMTSEGNVNYKADFDKLCQLDLDKVATYREIIAHLRAVSFQGYRNAYFLDKDGKKIYITVNLEKE